MGPNKVVYSIVSLLLIITAAYLGLHRFHKKSADRSDDLYRPSALSPEAFTLANKTHPSISDNRTDTESYLFDSAPKGGTTPEEINIPALKKTTFQLKLWGTITGNGVHAKDNAGNTALIDSSKYARDGHPKSWRC